MRFSRGILLSLLLTILPPDAATAQKQSLGKNSSEHLPETSLPLSRTEVLDAIKAEAGSIRIQNERSIRDNIQSEVDRSFGRTIGLIQMLLAVLTALPIFASIYLVLLRRSIIDKVAEDAKRQVTSKLDNEVAAALEQFHAKMQSEIDSFLAQNNERLATFFAEANENLKIISMKADTASSKMVAKDLDEAIANTSTFRKGSLRDMNEQGKVDYLWESAASFKRGDFGSAITAADMAIERQQSPLTASFIKGVALRKLNLLEEAISAFDRVTEMGPTGDPILLGAWIGKASALRKLGRLEDALSAYERAIEIDANDYAAWTGKAAALGGLKRYEEFHSASAKAKELEPNNDSKT